MDELIELIIRGLISLFSQPRQDQARRAPMDLSSQPGAPPPGYSAQNPPRFVGQNVPQQQQQRNTDEADDFVLPAQRILTPQQAQQQQDQHSLERMSPQQRLEIARQALLQRAQQQRAKQQQIEQEEELAQRMRDPRFAAKAKREMQRMQQAAMARQQQAADKKSAIQQAARQAAAAQAARQAPAATRAPAKPQTLKEAAQPAPVKFEALSVVSAKSHSSEFGKSSAGGKIADLLHANPAAVRQMFVLAEILQPPLALREGGNQRY